MKQFTILSLLLLLSLSLFSQGLPVDRKTKKVIYDGEIVLKDLTADQIADRVLTWLATETRFRGQFGPVVEYRDSKTIQTVVELNITHVIRTYLWWVKAVFTIEYSDGKLVYTLTDFYTYGSASILLLYPTEPTECPLEENTRFYIYDFNSMNDNAKNLNEQVNGLIELFTKSMVGNEAEGK
jgi:hypothetical protein